MRDEAEALDTGGHIGIAEDRTSPDAWRNVIDVPDPVGVVGGVGREPAWAVFGALVLRDPDLASHAVRGLLVATALAHGIGMRVDRTVFWGFALRDVGTLDVPAELLAVPRALTSAEREIIEAHPLHSAEIVSHLEGLEGAVPIVRHHHERWDGDGYPDGLTEREIPLAARLLAVGDTFAALTEPRPHRGPYSCSEAVDLICEAAAGQFDPGIVSALAAIANALPDPLTHPPAPPRETLGPRLAAHSERSMDLSTAQLEALFASVLGYKAADAAERLGRAEGTQRSWSSSLRRALAVPPRVTLPRFLAACGREAFLAFLP